MIERIHVVNVFLNMSLNDDKQMLKSNKIYNLMFSHSYFEEYHIYGWCLT